MSIPKHIRYLVVGAGVHGLSTAYHLATVLKSRGTGSGLDIVVLDKSNVGAGASGIACGVIRNNYFQTAMRELMVHSVEVWESDPDAYNYHSVGYIQAAPDVMQADVASIFRQQNEIGYSSALIEGEKECSRYMQDIFSDWQAKNISVVLHEKRGGYANNLPSMHALAAKAEGEGVKILTGVYVTGFRKHAASNAIETVVTDQGDINCEYVIIGVGPWIKNVWQMLELPKYIKVKNSDGTVHDNVPMWAFWSLQEGTLGVNPAMQKANDGSFPPVIHVDTDAPLYSVLSGKLLADGLWGIYYKPDFNFGGIQGGTVPKKINTDADEVNVDPYGPHSPDYIVDESFSELWVSALAHCQKRFESTHPRYKKEPSGGIGAFTPDSFPVFDVFCDNCYIIADSNHGYKMIGVGKLVADEIAGEKQGLLEPFRFSRYAEGGLHPVSNSPYPWS